MLANEVKSMEQENEALRYENALLKKRLESDPERKPMLCKDCKFFIRHYVKSGGSFSPIGIGHCTAGRGTKNREAYGKTCDYFEFGDYELRTMEMDKNVKYPEGRK